MGPIRFFLVALAAAFLSLRHEPVEARPIDLLGGTIEAAFAHLGLPESGHGDAGVQMWIWRDEKGTRLSASVHEGVVVRADPGLATAKLAPRAAPADGVYPGQPVAEAVARLGNPDRVIGQTPVSGSTPGSPGSASGPALIYGERFVGIGGGRVTRTWVPEEARGPR